MDYMQTWDALKHAIEQAHSLSDLKSIRDQAEAIRYSLKVAGESQELVRKAEVIKLRAERRAGEVLLSSQKQGPGDYRRSNGSSHQPLPPSYAEQGLDKTQAHRWQQVASIPVDEFEHWLETADEVSTSGALRLAKLRKDWTTYHLPTRSRQALHDDEVHHPTEKTKQIREFLPMPTQPYKILELFAGGEDGHLSKVYKEYGSVERYDKRLGTGDSFREIHRLVYERKFYDVVDLDPYGFPSRMFPHVFQLIDDGYLFVTFPHPGVNIVNRMNDVHQESYYGTTRPTEAQILDRITSWGLCHWRKVELIDSIEFASMWRFIFRVVQVRATDYVGIVLKPGQTGQSNSPPSSISAIVRSNP